MTTSASPPSAPPGVPRPSASPTSLPFADTEFPWLFALRPLRNSRSLTAVSLSPDDSRPPEAYSIPVPQPFQGHTVICADAHCLMIEYDNYRGPDNSGIHLVNPFDSWSQLGLLPSSSTMSEDPSEHPPCFRIVRIAMNSTAAVAMWGLTANFLAYTRLGVDRRWIDLGDIVGRDNFEDVAAYNGLFYAAYRCARRIIALDFSSPTVRVTDMTLNLPAYQEGNGWTSFQLARLVNSSSGLFLVRWRNLIKAGEKKRREIDVHRLMDDDADAPKRWAPVESLGSFSFFLGTKSLSVSLSTADFPRLRSNRIYIPHDADKRLHPEGYYSAPVDLDEVDDDFRHHLIYNLGDKTWGQYYSDPRSYCNGFCWMTPRLL